MQIYGEHFNPANLFTIYLLFIMNKNNKIIDIMFGTFKYIHYICPVKELQADARVLGE